MNLWIFPRRFPPCLAFAAVAFALVLPVGAGDRLTLNFNPDWKFIKADPAGAEAPAFNDRGWVNVSAPHTYNDTDTFDDWSLPGHRGEQNQWGGRTWYRKSFVAPEAFKGKKVYIEFEAVRQVAEVYLNGKLLGACKTGFTPFGFDLTPHLQFGRTNVLAVMCDNRFLKDPLNNNREGGTNAPGHAEAPRTEAPRGTNDLNIAPAANPNLAVLQNKFNQSIPERLEELQADQIPWNNPHWHPAHGGIYRNVRLYVTDPLHISLPLYSFLQTAGPYVHATDILNKSARVTVEVPIENGRGTGEKVELAAQVLDRNGKPVLALKHEGEVVGGASATFTVSGLLENPQLWEPDYPYLYRVACALRVNGQTVDTCEIPLGLRVTQWTTNQGFFINGHPVKLKGWGQKPTDEWPGLGAAQPDWLHFFTLALMREAGGNWVRWGHCPGGPGMIEASDRLGLMVQQPGLDGEADTVRAAWKLRASAFRDLIVYFRNNPSILIWEGGNQKISREHVMELRGYMDKYDPHGGRAYSHRRSDNVVGEFMDVCCGTEGGWELKQMAVVEGEYNREESPRRVWDNFSPPNFGYPEARGKSDYVLTSEAFALNQVPQFLKKLGAHEHCGGANWIFSDGTHGGRDQAEVARASGEVDGVRLPKEAYYVCQTMFRSSVPQVHILGHWTYPVGTTKTVYAVSGCEEVELFLNGKSLGRGGHSPPYIFSFSNVVFQAGDLRAVGYMAGKVAATDVLRTAGRPVALRLKPITGPGGLRADGSDVLLIDVEAVDSKGQRCPTFQQRVDFETNGHGTWRGGYNSGKTNSVNNPWLDLEAGVNRVAVRATRTAGSITVRAKSRGLKSDSLTVKSLPVKVEHGYTAALPVMPPVTLPKERPAALQTAIASRPSTRRPAQSGKFIREFSYSGPAAGVRIETNAQSGKKIFGDRDETFAALPAALEGADYVQAADADRLYSAVDLMEIAVKAGSTLSVAHDDRLPRPDWLTRHYRPAAYSLTINGQRMTLFQRRAEFDESFTLGANTEEAGAKPGNMYIVFVKGAE